MDKVSEKVCRCCECIQKKTDFKPQLAIVLGSGLGAFADSVEKQASVNYCEVENLAVPAVSGHKGRFVFGEIEGIKVVVAQGRVHYYEGYSMQDVVLPVRIMRMLGAKALILTNAAGGINETYAPGDFMLLKGHISSLVPSPLIGENADLLGERFPDMSEVYDSELRGCIKAAAKSEKIDIHEGVYIQTGGPNYETPEEIKMFKAWGADAVGMSTACEAIAAKHAGMKVCAVSCISNMAAGISKSPLSHAEVKQMADMASDSFKRLLISSVRNIAKML